MGWVVYDSNNIISNGRSLQSGEPGSRPDGFGNFRVLSRMKPHAIYAGVAKTEVELRRLEKVNAGNRDRTPALGTAKDPGIMYMITREEIEASDYTRFLADFGPAVGKERLCQIAGRVSFTVQGYEDREEEIFEIPEIREYFQLAHKRWPCWLFAADVRTACLHAITLCVLQKIDIIRAPGTGINQVQSSLEDLKAFFEESLRVTAIMDSRAGISRKLGAKRIEALAEYLGI